MHRAVDRTGRGTTTQGRNGTVSIADVLSFGFGGSQRVHRECRECGLNLDVDADACPECGGGVARYELS